MELRTRYNKVVADYILRVWNRRKRLNRATTIGPLYVSLSVASIRLLIVGPGSFRTSTRPFNPIRRTNLFYHSSVPGRVSHVGRDRKQII